MSDLFTAAKVAAPTEEKPKPKAPRMVRVQDSTAYAFIHECNVCGSPLAPYGEGVALSKGRPGTWFCRNHWAERVARR
jgi:hypothetical protein